MMIEQMPNRYRIDELSSKRLRIDIRFYQTYLAFQRVIQRFTIENGGIRGEAESHSPSHHLPNVSGIHRGHDGYI